MARSAFRRFKPRTPLTADDLNAALDAAVKQAAFTAAAPSCVGLFRPGTGPSGKAFALDGDDLKVTMLGAVLRSGEVVVIESERLHFPLGHVAFLDDLGALTSRLSRDVPDAAFRLVHRRTKKDLDIVAEIAAVDADAALDELDKKAREASRIWQEALKKASRDVALADAADTVVLDPDVERERRIATLLLFSRALDRRMSPEARDRWPAMSKATKAPNSSQYPNLITWLKDWSTLMADDSLRAEFLDPKGWRAPNSVFAGRNEMDRREACFDLGDSPAEKVEIFSPFNFANSRWRFGESGQERPFPNAERTAEGWSVQLETSGSRLYVWTDLASPETLRIRPINHAAGTAK